MIESLRILKRIENNMLKINGKYYFFRCPKCNCSLILNKDCDNCGCSIKWNNQEIKMKLKLDEVPKIPRECLEKVEKLAIDAHKGQKRWNGEPYIIHPMRIAQKFVDKWYYGLALISLLHDILEDTKITEKDLIKFGIEKYYINVIKILTKKEKENYYDFIMRISKNETAIRVKLGDIEDNLNDNMKNGSLKDKYLLARHILQKSLKSLEEE